MLFFLPVLAAAAIGGIGAASQKKPKQYDPKQYGLGPLWDFDRQSAFANSALDYLQNVATGGEKGLTQGEMSQMTAPGRAHLRQGLNQALMQMGEGSLARGLGARGGQHPQNVLAANRQFLDAMRGLETNTVNYALQQRGQDRDRALRANQIGFGAIGNERALQADQARMQYGVENARHQMGGPFRRFLQGAAAGAGMGMGMGGGMGMGMA